MLFLVLAEARDTIVGEAVAKLRQEVGTAIKRIEASGKLKSGGILGGRRMAYMLLEVESTAEIMDLLGGEIIDNMQTDLYPILSFAELGAFFAKEAAG
jgi:hypothetical protein